MINNPEYKAKPWLNTTAKPLTAKGSSVDLPVVTLAIPENGGGKVTTLAIPENGGGKVTTLAIPENGGGKVTTLAIPENGGGSSVDPYVAVKTPWLT
ncbi:MAG: hypothetical protein ACK551_08780 [Vampirovibrionales bacterium]